MTDLLAEVDDLMRRERMEKFWRDHRGQIIGVITALILLTAAHSYYSSWNAKTRMGDTERLMTLVTASDFPANIGSADFKRGDSAALAQLMAAGAYLNRGETENALALYEKVAKESGAKKEISQLALLMKIRLAAQELKAGDADKRAALLQDLRDIYSDADSPWQPLARLDASLLHANGGDYAAAREVIAPALKQELPPSMSAKLRSLDHIYMLQAQKPAAGQGKKS